MSTPFPIGRPEAPTVVLVHSSGGTPRQWGALAAALAGFGLRVATPRLVGHDGARGWGDRAPSLQGEVEHLLEQLPANPGRVHLVGHSHGAAVAIKAALSRALDVASLVVYEPTPFALLGATLDRYPLAISPLAVAQRIASALADGRDLEAATVYVDYWAAPGTFAAMPPERRARIAERMPVVEACFRSLIWDTMRPADLRRLDAPALVMGGTRSPQPAQDLCEVVAASLRRGRYHRFLSLDHMGPVAHPETVNAVVLEFLQQRCGFEAARAAA